MREFLGFAGCLSSQTSRTGEKILISKNLNACKKINRAEKHRLVRFFENSTFNVSFVNEIGNRIGLIKLRYYLAQLKPNTGKRLQKRSKDS